jgi:hypothetical protein
MATPMPVWSDLTSWAALGGFLGAMSFLFTVWDRLVRRRPIAWTVAVARDFGQPFPYLRVKNVGRTHLFIIGLRSNNPAYGIGDSESVGGQFEPQLGMPRWLYLLQMRSAISPYLAANKIGRPRSV